MQPVAANLMNQRAPIFATPFWQSCLGSEEESRRTNLERLLQIFYSSVDNYEAFQSENSKPEFWLPIRSTIETILSRGPCKVLEIGAGRTGFADYLGITRQQLEFHVQDITARNGDYLSKIADKVWLCEVTEIEDTYDVIFSTFVYEHMTRPRATLEHQLAMLRPNGSIFLASPRYDLPGYFSPSARHLPWARRLELAVQLMLRRIRVLCGGPADFLIHLEPAAFHGPWFRDADAVHWASLWDLKRWLPDGVVMRPQRIRAAGLRGRFWARFLLLFVRIQCPKLGANACETKRPSLPGND
jgi:SAM-dependent methyltransferase